MIDRTVISDILKAVEAIKDSIYPTLKDVIDQNANYLQRIQTEVQFYQKSEKQTTITITPLYADSTKSIKLRNNQPTDRVTLKDTGEFYRSVIVTTDTNNLIIEASVDYAKYLTKKYGADILGIQNMELKEFLEKFYYDAQKKEIDQIIERYKI